MSEDNSYIFNSKNDQKNTDHDTNILESQYYTIAGHQDYYDENNNPRLIVNNKKTLAKITFTDKNKPRYLIKVNTDGKFHNPLNIVSKQKMVSNFLDRTCKEPKFKSVSNIVFNMYLNFLKSKNLSWLYNADREAE